MSALSSIVAAQRVSAGADPFYANVVSLLNMNQADGTTFTDAKGKTWTAFGNAQIISNYYVGDGSGDYILTSSSNDFDFGTGDFTVEAFVQSATKDRVIADFRAPATPGLVTYNKATTGFLGAFANTGTPTEILGTSDIANNVEHHIAFSRVSGVLYVCVDGAVSNSGAFTNSITGAANPCYMGAASNATQSWNGKIRGFRVTKGVGRYSGAYTVPTWPLPTF